jgi:hypothetical protein
MNVGHRSEYTSWRNHDGEGTVRVALGFCVLEHLRPGRRAPGGQPAAQRLIGQAKRLYASESLGDGSRMHRHARPYTLYLAGAFFGSGSSPISTPTSVAEDLKQVFDPRGEQCRRPGLVREAGCLSCVDYGSSMCSCRRGMSAQFPDRRALFVMSCRSRTTREPARTHRLQPPIRNRGFDARWRQPWIRIRSRPHVNSMRCRPWHERRRGQAMWKTYL